jgi:hypothetical protein
MSERERVTVFSVTVERTEDGKAFASIRTELGGILHSVLWPEGLTSTMSASRIMSADGVVVDQLGFTVYVPPEEPAVRVAQRAQKKREGTMNIEDQKRIGRAEDQANARDALLLAIEQFEASDADEDVKREVASNLVAAMREYLTDEARGP